MEKKIKGKKEWSELKSLEKTAVEMTLLPFLIYAQPTVNRRFAKVRFSPVAMARLSGFSVHSL